MSGTILHDPLKKMQKNTLIDLTVNWTIMGYGPYGCLCKKHSPLIVWAIVWLSIPRYTWRHPTISHTLSGFGRESPAGHPTKKGLSQAVLCVVFLQSWILSCFAMCETYPVSPKHPTLNSTSKKDFTSAVSHCRLTKVQLYSTQLSAASPAFAPLPGHAQLCDDRSWL